MLKLAVLGKDVSQSDSPRIHNFILESLGKKCAYDKISIPSTEFSDRIEEFLASYDGLNITIPFKGEVIPFMKKLKGDALSFGAVNTVVCKKRIGYNTDGAGFLLMLENEGIELKGKSALVLGAGGAGRSCIRKLIESGAEVYAYERDEERLYAVYSEFAGFTPCREVPFRNYDIVINCTGIGMHNTVGKTPAIAMEGGGIVPAGEELLSRCETVVDLIYVPAESEFLRIGRELGKRTVNGVAMLFYQAYYADCLFLKKKPNAAAAKKLYTAYMEENK